MKILNLGSGDRPIDGAVNLDFSKEVKGVDIEHDLEKPLPFGDNEFDCIVALHILEHIRNLSQLMGEIHRVGKNGAEVIIHAPHYTNPTFWDDITHVRPWSEGTIDFLTNSKNDGKRGFKGTYRTTYLAVSGEPWSFERPTAVVARLAIVKGE